MKKLHLLTIIIFLFSSFVFSQDEIQKDSLKVLYKDLLYKMPIKDAHKVFKKTKKNYTNIDFGNGVVWRLYKQNMVNVDDKLVALVLKPTGYTFGMDNDVAQVYLQVSKNFLTTLNYEVFIEPEYWDVPVMFSALNKYGLILINKKKDIAIELRPVSMYENTFIVNLGIYNYTEYMEYYLKQNQVNNKTGF